MFFLKIEVEYFDNTAYWPCILNKDKYSVISDLYFIVNTFDEKFMAYLSFFLLFTPINIPQLNISYYSKKYSTYDAMIVMSLETIY